MPATEPKTGLRVPELDGLRGLAILMVMVWHFMASPLQRVPGPLALFTSRTLHLTGSGVDLFFVLSGFLIGGILLDHRESPNYFKAFYTRRFCRIVPLYFAWLGLFYIVLRAAPAFVASPALQRIFHDPFPAWSYATFTQNLLMARQETFGPDWLGVTWSLAVEEQFYILLPLMIRFIAAPRLPFACAALVLAAPVLRGLGASHGSYGALVLMPCRADALLLGVLCALLMRSDGGRRRVETGRGALYGILVASTLACMAVLAFPTAAQHTRNPGFTSLLAVLYTSLLLIAVTERRGPVTWLVRNRWLRGLGLLAYGAYLIHQAVNGLAHGMILGRLPAFGTLPEIAVTLGAFALTVALAALSWWKLEKPFVSWGHSMRYAASPVAVAADPVTVG